MSSSNATTLSILNDTRRPDWRRFPDAVGYLLAEIEDRPNTDIASNKGEKVKINFQGLTMFSSQFGTTISIVAKSSVPRGENFHTISVSGDEWLNAFELYVVAASKL